MFYSNKDCMSVFNIFVFAFEILVVVTRVKLPHEEFVNMKCRRLYTLNAK